MKRYFQAVGETRKLVSVRTYHISPRGKFAISNNTPDWRPDVWRVRDTEYREVPSHLIRLFIVDSL